MKVDFGKYKRMLFSDLEKGECFVSTSNAVYIRCQDVTRVNGKSKINAINLSTGEATCFSDESVVSVLPDAIVNAYGKLGF